MNHTMTRRAALAALALTMSVTLSGCALLAVTEETTSPQDAVATEEVVAETTLSDGQGQEADALAAQSVALDAYVAAGQSEIAGLLDAYASTYIDIKYLTVLPDTVEYVYVYKDPLDVALATAALDEQIPTLQDQCDQTLFPLMEQAGITIGPKVRYSYYNPDGSLIWSYTFEKS